MRLGGDWEAEQSSADDIALAETLILTAVEQGINFFDHADIYSNGKAERVFGEVLKRHAGLRERIFIQSKCGIRVRDSETPFSAHRYDFSSSYLLKTVDEMIARLDCGYLDVLLLHRPDALTSPDEVADVFDQLHAAGKVRHFGVSNHTAARMRLLGLSVRQPLVANQLQLSLGHLNLIEEETMANNSDAVYPGYSGALDYCRETGAAIQAWSPLAGGVPLRVDGALKDVIFGLAHKYDVSGEAVMLAWLLRHPARIQPIVGTTDAERLRQCCEADRVNLEREEWYALYEAARGKSVP